ncbi:MAG: nickel-dependent lactate racemase [Candidatus Latescibacteria bacterium]|nr:nickel-dependent lactate racemase [Candidatus Latescibacterota bacterium]
MIPVHFGSDIIELDIPQENLAFNLHTAESPPATDEKAEIRQSIEHPVGCERLRDMVPANASVVILGDDRTRLTPQDKIVPVVLEELYAAGVKREQIRIIIAYGTHRPMTQEEIVAKYGSEVVSDIEIRHHDCLDAANLVDHGVTRRGTRIFVNKECLEADIRIGIGSVIPHYPTGWSGGAKILLPGVAGGDTTYAMHMLGVSEQALGQITSPVRDEMEDFAREVGLHFIVNVLHNAQGQVIRSFAGHCVKAHRAAVQQGLNMYGAPFAEKADITLSSTWPVDFDLTQSSKGLFSAECVTKPGGEIILLSPCHEGIAPTHGDEMLRLALYDNDVIQYMIEKKDVQDPLGATECMYYNLIKNKFKATVMMDKATTESLGFFHLSPVDLPIYIKLRLENNNMLKIGIINQSTEILPIFRAQ